MISKPSSKLTLNVSKQQSFCNQFSREILTNKYRGKYLIQLDRDMLYQKPLSKNLQIKVKFLKGDDRNQENDFISYSSKQQTFVTKSRSPSNPCSQGTIQILHKLFDWVGGFRNWPFLLTNSTLISLIHAVSDYKKRSYKKQR